MYKKWNANGRPRDATFRKLYWLFNSHNYIAFRMNKLESFSCNTPEELRERAKYWINEKHSINDELEFNRLRGSKC